MYEGGGNFLPLISRRFKQLVIPFVLWTFVWIIVNDHLSLRVFLDYIIFPGRGLWFLWVLFLINVLFLLGSALALRIKLSQEFVIICFCLILAGIMSFVDIRVLGFQFVAYYFIFYSLGYFLHKYERLLVTKNNLIIILVLVWAFLAWFWQMHNLPSFLVGFPVPATLLQYLYRFITAAIAVYVLIIICPRFLNKDCRWNKPFIGFGVVSLGIYTVHLILMGKVVAFYNSFEITTVPIIILAFVSGLVISWVIVWLINRWKLTARLLLGKI